VPVCRPPPPPVAISLSTAGPQAGLAYPDGTRNVLKIRKPFPCIINDNELLSCYALRRYPLFI
jgi:hypothetical protein